MKKAFCYRYVYAPYAIQAPANNPLEFNQDIQVAVKAGEFGQASVRDPRFVTQGTNT